MRIDLKTFLRNSNVKLTFQIMSNKGNNKITELVHMDALKATQDTSVYSQVYIIHISIL